MSTEPQPPAPIGAFSISLAVSDLAASRAFYEALGFSVTGGQQDEGWLILVNGEAVVGLFSGHVERNTLTFTPRMDNRMQPRPEWPDVREIQARLEAAGLALETRTDPNGEGPGHITLIDPDGNPVLIDQF
jgi:catechol 2,3-dioxygenase-like lactoylglutathione lyase family enzyme